VRQHPAGYRRFEEGSHVLFFKFDAAGMLVVRVLHKRMIPKLHITAQDEDE
jgi:plasmid stabilization system protein ParE